MDCCLCEKRAKPNTLPGGVGGQWWLISIMLTIDLSNCVLRFTVKCDKIMFVTSVSNTV